MDASNPLQHYPLVATEVLADPLTKRFQCLEPVSHRRGVQSDALAVSCPLARPSCDVVHLMRNTVSRLSQPPAITIEVLLVHCPICSTPLSQEVIHNVTVDVCNQHGLWLDQGEMLLISESERHKVGRFSLSDLMRQAIQPSVDPQRSLNCPQCQSEMGLEVYKEVHLDRCRTHGIWLDTGELQALLNNLRLDPLYRRGSSIRLWEGQF